MSQRIGDVRAAVPDTDTQAASVRETAGSLESAMAHLRVSMVRVVRLSSKEANRRGEDRIPVELAARLVPDGKRPEDVMVLDLSSHGTRISTSAQLPVGTRGVLTIQGISLPMVVRHVHEHNQLGVAFLPDAAQQRDLDALLTRLEASRTKVA
jgi:hypothetical protein